MADTSLVSRVRTKLELLGGIMAKNIAKTVRRQLEGRHLLFGEYLRSWTNLNVGTRRHAELLIPFGDGRVQRVTGHTGDLLE